MNLLEPHHSVRRWPSPRTRDWLTLFLERAEADKNVVAVIVIGSAIRPEVASDDLDLLVLCRDVARSREKAPIEIDLRKADLHRVEEKILAEAPGAREEVVGAFLDQPPDIGGLVDVVAALLADRAEGLDADGQLASWPTGGSLP